MVREKLDKSEIFVLVLNRKSNNTKIAKESVKSTACKAKGSGGGERERDGPGEGLENGVWHDRSKLRGLIQQIECL